MPRPLTKPRPYSPATPWTVFQDPMTVAEAAGKIGVCEKFYRILARRGEVPITVFSRTKHRVKKAELQAWLAGTWRPQESATEPRPHAPAGGREPR